MERRPLGLHRHAADDFKFNAKIRIKSKLHIRSMMYNF